jgi:hypothetical protein
MRRSRWCQKIPSILGGKINMGRTESAMEGMWVGKAQHGIEVGGVPLSGPGEAITEGPRLTLKIRDTDRKGIRTPEPLLEIIVEGPSFITRIEDLRAMLRRLEGERWRR